MEFRFVVLLVALSAMACARHDATPRVTVEPLASGDWRATWDAGAPVESLQFVRAAGFLREREWRVVTPGYAFARAGDTQVLALVDGRAAADRIVIDFPRNTDFIERDYELFNTFTDGSVALFLGHFAATLNGAGVIDRVVVVPPAGQRVIGGDYAYVGNIKPVEHDRLVAIVDPGLPPWLASSLTHYTPRLLDFYAERTGHALVEKPVVLFSADPGARGRSFNGGVVGNQLQLRVLGDDWRRDDPWAVRAALRLIAHEAAHLWNGNEASTAPPWMHEGGAEAFADEALVAVGLFDGDALRAAHERALNECLRGRRVHYSCGEVAAWWSGLAVGDLFAFWGELVARAAAAGDGYDERDYFETLADAGAAPATIAALQAFVDAPRDEAVAALRAGLAAHGVSLVRDDAAADPATLKDASAQVVFAVLGADCTGTYGFVDRGDWLELGGLGDCRAAREGLRVDRLGPHALAAPGFAAARYASARCAEHRTLEMAGLEFDCPAELPDLAGYWRIE